METGLFIILHSPNYHSTIPDLVCMFRHFLESHSLQWNAFRISIGRRLTHRYDLTAIADRIVLCITPDPVHISRCWGYSHRELRILCDKSFGFFNRQKGGKFSSPIHLDTQGDSHKKLLVYTLFACLRTTIIIDNIVDIIDITDIIVIFDIADIIVIF